MNFAEKLQKLRKEHGLSQEELADQLSVSRQAVSRWENGQGFPETDKLLFLSSLFNVSLDYLLKNEGLPAEADGEQGYYASREMVDGFLSSKRQGARRIALGVAVIILSVCFPLLLDEPGSPRLEELGVVLLLIGVAIGVAILVMQGFRPKHYEELEQQPLVFDNTFLREFKAQYAQRRRRYGKLIVAGILIVFADIVFSALISEVLLREDTPWMGLFPIPIALAVALFIVAGSAFSSEAVIANNAQHMEEVREEKRFGWVYGAVMPLAAMVFLAIGFIWNAWHPGWLVFPVAALLATGIVSLLRYSSAQNNPR